MDTAAIDPLLDLIDIVYQDRSVRDAGEFGHVSLVNVDVF